LSSGFFVQRMMSRLHSYHLDDAPNLKSCNLVFKALPGTRPPGPSAAITDGARLEHFYGRDNPPKVRYVREKKRLDYGKAHEDEYYFESWEAS
jgi:N4-bis(aminopropyl)spermidine synthase